MSRLTLHEDLSSFMIISRPVLLSMRNVLDKTEKTHILCRSSAAHLLRLWVRIPPRSWVFVCCECCVLSGTGLCDGLITRPEESYRLWRVVVCDQENIENEEAKAR